MARFLRKALLTLSAAFAGCGASPAPNQPLADQTLVISIAFEPPASCRITFTGESFSYPAQEAGLRAALVRHAVRFHHARIASDQSVPYRCLGGTIYLAQRAGFRRVGFTAAPPPPAEAR